MGLQQAVWIVHGDARAQAALVRMAGPFARGGPPRLAAFSPSPSPAAIVLHVPLAAAEALAFAHAASAAHPRAHWLLAAEPGLDPGWLRDAFAGLPLTLLGWPIQPAPLQRALRVALAGDAPPVAARLRLDVLSARLARTLGDLALPDLLHDASGHLCVIGERGTGKLLLARTLHAVWDAEPGEGRAGFALVSVSSGDAISQLPAQLRGNGGTGSDPNPTPTLRWVVCVEDPAAAAPHLQRELASWVELGVPGAPIDPTRLLWLFLRPESFGASAPLEDTLAELCETPALRIPPLRERPGAALRSAEQWLREWSAANRVPARELSDAAREAIDGDPWPGNTRELEAALRRAVASPASAPLEPEALGLARSPLPAPSASEAEHAALTELPRTGDAREFDSVIEELDAARADEAAGADFETRRDTQPRSGRHSRSAEVVDALLDLSPPASVAGVTAAAAAQPPEPEASRSNSFDALLRAAPAEEAGESVAVSDAALAELSLDSPRTIPLAEASGANETATAAAASAPPPAQPGPDLRAFARAAARELAPALELLRARANDPAATIAARRLARLEQFASLDADPSAHTEVAPLLAALLAERRDELLARRILVLRELESADTLARGNEPALRFAFAAVLDTLLEAAPPRTDLYVSARATSTGGARPILRAELRLRSAKPPEVALDLALARDLVTRLGATLSLITDDAESRATLDLPR
jgi:hypothetical protein